MPNPEVARNTSSRSRAMRVKDVRETNYMEEPPERAVELFTTGVSDTTDEAGAAFGVSFTCPGYERWHLHMAFLIGAGDVTTVHVRAQCSHDGATWYDVMQDRDGDGTLAQDVYTMPVDAADANLAWPDLRRVSRYMRFKAWTTGGSPTRTGTRIVLRGRRVMDAH